MLPRQWLRLDKARVPDHNAFSGLLTIPGLARGSVRRVPGAEMIQFAKELRRAIAADAPILALLAPVCTVLLLILARRGVNGLAVEAYGQNLQLYLFFLAMMTIAVFCRLLIKARPESPIGFLFELVRSPATARFFARGTPMLLALIIYMPIFSAMKSAIPLFHDYNWDATLIAADHTIFGSDPWRVLQPVIGYPIVTSALSVAYHAWILLVFAGGIYFNFIVQDDELRARYFVTFFAIWTVIGIALATGLASVGPCFVGPLLGNHHYDAQMAYLNEANQHYRVMVLSVQQELLEWQLHNAHGLGRGISAMPSMHVGLATLFALAMWRHGKVAGSLATVFAVIIAVGSVHLGYHYAVDGIVAATATIAIWALAAPFARWTVRRAVGSPARTLVPDPALA